MLACVLAVPLLHVLIAAIALGSGFVAEKVDRSTTYLKYAPAAVLRELRAGRRDPGRAEDARVRAGGRRDGVLHRADPRDGSEGVGRAATDSVVACCLLVLAADVLLVGLIRVLG